MKLTKIQINEIVKEYFPELDEQSMNLFLSISDYHQVGNKQILLKPEKTDKKIAFILKGVARAYEINNKGEELNNFLRAQGHLMADAKIFGEEKQSLIIESVGEVHYLVFDISKLEELGASHPGLMTFYLDFLKEIILTLSYRLNTFITMTPKERYIDLITWNPILLETVYDKHIASFLGITPLTIHRIKKTI